MCRHNSHDPVQCIIPPYMSDKLLDAASNARLPAVLNNELRSSRFRNDRSFFGNLNDAQRSVLLKPAKAPTKPVLKMQVYDMEKDTVLSNGKLVWNNGKALKTMDTDTKNVVAAGTATWDLYYQIFGRNSIDNLGLALKHYIHYDNKYDNAFWDGRRMVYGDGDGKIFGSFTADPDIIGHELTHGVTQYESNLVYHNQSGALNESLSDVFGIMIKQRLLNQDVKKSKWLIGENVLKGAKYSLRSMKAPGTAYVNHPDLGTDPQPATFDKYMVLPDTDRGDWGGVHINSGITNFAFYVTAFNIGGFSWEKAGMIWYAAMTDKENFQPTSNFEDFKNLTIQKAELLFGSGSLEANAVTDGWAEAKV
ncbi:M4 family metallopeptidase [Dyadobacter sp. CY345]|uniref:M4 family metallopeptidase n=1 Tax=Dyadobacter sp. CY345 TaxID=2909335 RepID=UPI001F2F3DAB|nr:M4 family metallopeptidase [Dyadobacter sp. CY345]MCF2446293.1 M4 family metallopeptidase [Dyadobacter sp. CY345]